MTVKLLLVPEREASSVSWYRAVGAFAALRRMPTPIEIDFTLEERVHWATIASHDIVFLQRSHDQKHLKVIEIARALGRPVWLDYDDDLFSIPQDNPVHAQFSNKDAQRRIVKCIGYASVVTVSTQALATRFAAWNPNVVVVPNAHNMDLIGELASEPSKITHVLWRGSDTHQRDVHAYREPILRAIARYPEWTFTFMGWNAWPVTSFVPAKANVQVIDAIDTSAYFEFIRDTTPAIAIVPLVDNAFNRAKSNIAALEATFAGAVPIVPDWPEWQLDGWQRYESPQQMGAKLLALLGSVEDRARAHAAAREAVLKSGYTIEAANRIRAAIVGTLMQLQTDRKWCHDSRRDKVRVDDVV